MDFGEDGEGDGGGVLGADIESYGAMKVREPAAVFEEAAFAEFVKELFAAATGA